MMHQSYDGFLKERAVEPRLAGLSVNILVPSRGIRWERIQLRPTDAPNELVRPHTCGTCDAVQVS
jgi:hypothetical protein